MSRPIVASRADDERILRMLALRWNGHNATTIGRDMNVSPAYVRSILSRVRSADAATESFDVAAEYWA